MFIRNLIKKCRHLCESIDSIESYTEGIDEQIESLENSIDTIERIQRIEFDRLKSEIDSIRKNICDRNNNTEMMCVNSSREEFKRWIPLLPREVAFSIEQRSLKIVDSVIYQHSVIEGCSCYDLFGNAKIYTTNIRDAKLPCPDVMLITGIRLLAYQIFPDEEMNYSLFERKHHIPSDVILNSDIEIGVSGKVAVPRISCRVFDIIDNKHGKGYYKLDCPFMIAPQSKIYAELNLPSEYSSRNAFSIRIELIGARIIHA